MVHLQGLVADSDAMPKRRSKDERRHFPCSGAAKVDHGLFLVRKEVDSGASRSLPASGRAKSRGLGRRAWSCLSLSRRMYVTIVVAGFESQDGLSIRAMTRVLEGPPSTLGMENIGFRERRHDYLCKLRRPRQAFVYADSLLSREIAAQQDTAQPGARALAKRVPAAQTAKKIAAVDLVLSIPDLDPEGYPTGRFHPHQRDTCGIAYSGDSHMYQLTAEHFRRRAERLHYTWLPPKSGPRGGPGSYGICEAGSPIDVGHPANRIDAYDESINFAGIELPALKANTVLRMFRAAFDDALNDYVELETSYRTTYQENPVKIEFVLLTYCRATHQPVIYHVNYHPAYGRHVSGYKSSGSRLMWNDLAVLGMESARGELQLARDGAITRLASIDSHVGYSVRTIVKREAGNGYVGGKVCRGILDSYGFRLLD